MANVMFKRGTSAQYHALTTKDAYTLYWLEDVQQLWLGDKLYGIGDLAGAISQAENNTLEFRDDGLFVPAADAPAILQSGTLKTVTEANAPYDGAAVGDPYLELIFTDEEESTSYVPLTGLFETYSPGNGITIEDGLIAVGVDTTKANGLVAVGTGLGLELATTTTAGAMSAVDKAYLDTVPEKLTALETSIEELTANMTWSDI